MRLIDSYDCLIWLEWCYWLVISLSGRHKNFPWYFGLLSCLWFWWRERGKWRLFDGRKWRLLHGNYCICYRIAACYPSIDDKAASCLIYSFPFQEESWTMVIDFSQVFTLPFSHSLMTCRASLLWIHMETKLNVNICFGLNRNCRRKSKTSKKPSGNCWQPNPTICANSMLLPR